MGILGNSRVAGTCHHPRFYVGPSAWTATAGPCFRCDCRRSARNRGLVLSITVENYFALQWPERKDLRYLIAGFAILAAISAVEALLIYLSVLHGNDDRRQIEAQLEGTLPLFLFLVLALIYAPVCEELIFRGFIFRGWSQTYLGPVGTIWLTALLFGLNHTYSIYAVLDATCFGLVAGWTRWRSRSISVPILLHVIKNCLATIAGFFDV